MVVKPFQERRTIVSAIDQGALLEQSAGLMVCAANYSNACIETLILATPREQPAKPGAIRMPEVFSAETVAQWVSRRIPFAGRAAPRGLRVPGFAP